MSTVINQSGSQQDKPLLSLAAEQIVPTDRFARDPAFLDVIPRRALAAAELNRWAAIDTVSSFKAIVSRIIP
jgi:hypothetical protein